MEKFRSKKIVEFIFTNAKEPYLFISCCFEYERYRKWLLKNNNKPYFSNFILYQDATASGSQLLSILFLNKVFAEYVNLTGSEKRNDFYSLLITQFLNDFFLSDLEVKEMSSYVDSFDKSKVLSNESLRILRKMLKVNIMALAYGLTYETYSKNCKTFYYKSENKCVIDDIFKFTGEFNINFLIKSFWKFLKKLPLFQLSDMIEYVLKSIEIRDKNLPLCWSIYNNNKIYMHDIKKRKKESKNKIKNLLRTYFTYYDISEMETDSSKQQTSGVANIIHSLDANLMFSVLSKLNIPIVPIHDCWGVPTDKVVELRKVANSVYTDQVRESSAYNMLVRTLSNCIFKVAGKEGVENFHKYLSKKIKFGDLTADDISKSNFFIYY